MIFKFNFAYDKKSGDILALRVVTNHAVAVRDYVMMKDKPESKDALFIRFPGDYTLITQPVEYTEEKGLCIAGEPKVTEFVDIVGDSNV